MVRSEKSSPDAHSISKGLDGPASRAEPWAGFLAERQEFADIRALQMERLLGGPWASQTLSHVWSSNSVIRSRRVKARERHTGWAWQPRYKPLRTISLRPGSSPEVPEVPGSSKRHMGLEDESTRRVAGAARQSAITYEYAVIRPQSGKTRVAVRGCY